MGGGGGGSTFIPNVPPAIENYPAYKAGEIGESMWNMTAPTRSSFMDIYSKFLDPAGGYNVSNLPGYAANYNLARTGFEDAYNAARGNILASTPRGGAMYGNLAQLEMDRAKNIGLAQNQLTAAATKDIMDKAYNTGFVAGPTTALAGLGLHAGDTRTSANAQLAATMQAQQMIAQQQAAKNAQANQGKSSGMGLLGTGIGSLIGMGMAPMTGGGSLFGSGLSALGGGLSSGKGGGGGITSGLGGYGTLMSQANPLGW